MPDSLPYPPENFNCGVNRLSQWSGISLLARFARCAFKPLGLNNSASPRHMAGQAGKLPPSRTVAASAGEGPFPDPFPFNPDQKY